MRSTPIFKILSAAVLAAVVVLLGVQTYRYFHRPLSVSAAYTSQVSDSISVTGWVVRQETALPEVSGTLLRQVRQKFDFCLLDAPAGLGRGFRLATCAADRCVVVTTSDASSLRDAQHTVMELGRFPNGTLHLVVNRVRKKLLRSMHATIDDAIDRAGLPLLGVVPEDDSLPLSLNQGMPPLPPQASAAAYRNIAHRLQGQRVPLLRIK